MKLVCLNIYGGALFKPLMEFIKDSAADTDIFCFQEVFQSAREIPEIYGMKANIYGDLKSALPESRGYFAPARKDIDGKPFGSDIAVGQAVFVKKSLDIDSEGSMEIAVKEKMQYLRFKLGGKNFVICNLHGASQPGDKLDNEERLMQSEAIKSFLKKESGAKILCGDFNLMPNTKSLRVLEENMENLIKKFNIPTTRNLNLAVEMYGLDRVQKFADYILVSKDINVHDFQVLDLPVSDHLPLVLEFS